MLIEIKKQTTEAVEIKTPYYCKSNYSHYMITDKGDLIIVGSRQITIWEAENMFNKSSIREALEASIECPWEEFDQALRDTVIKIAEHIGNEIRISDVATIEHPHY